MLHNLLDFMTILTLNDTFEKYPKEHSSHLPSSADPVYPSLIVRHPVHQHQQQIPLLLTAHNFPGLTQGRLGNDDVLVFNLTGVHPTEYVERVDFHLQSKSSFKQNSRLDQKKSQMEVDILDLSRPQRPKIDTIPLTRAQSGSWQTLDITDSIIACLEGEAEQHHLVGVAIKGPEITDVSEVVSQPFLVLFSEDDDHLDIEELGRDANLIRRKREAKRGRQQSASVIAQQLCTATRRQVSRFTVDRRIQKGGLFAHSPERCLPLKVAHRRHRLQWCREHKNWTTDQWSRVLFTDESRFSTRSDSQRVLIWREIETLFYSSNIKERHRYDGPGVLVMRGIMLNG
ncbi:uncharacterized protein TNCV_3042391 [Trichonephila clavipes]|nr:uncharacterized protein TNCV_3042391 [Trichonephila clavipes]